MRDDREPLEGTVTERGVDQVGVVVAHESYKQTNKQKKWLLREAALYEGLN